MIFLWELQIIPISSNQFRAIAVVQISLTSPGKPLLILKFHSVLILIKLIEKASEIVEAITDS